MTASRSVANEQLVACVTVTGTVQGVGFRPFVFGLAERIGLTGSVRNCGGSVEIELFGDQALLDAFLRDLRTQCPPLASIDQVAVQSSVCNQPRPSKFIIAQSADANAVSLRVPADAATCADCLAEVNDQENRRYLYPFTNCTNCGPRFTVIDDLPYDRSATTMSCFPMCVECAAEYSDPKNRRFHAQPNACWVCGPQLMFLDRDEQFSQWSPQSSLAERRSAGMAALSRTAEVLQAGKIVALKGLGGFHLACDALSADTVVELRRRKKRNGKPFGVMFASLEQVQQFCQVSPAEERLLEERTRPLVLLQKRPNSGIAADVSQGLGWIGAMLPYTPLQSLLLKQHAGPLVMTSGNMHEEPIAIGNRQALDSLKDIAHAFLLNNRDIHCRFDDSVSRLVAGEPLLIRRARGYAPQAIKVPAQSPSKVLALGGHLKNTFTLLSGDTAFVSQHIGDAGSPEIVDFQAEVIEHFQRLFRVQPDAIACDLHPDYQTTSIAQRLSAQRGLPLFQIQHHHAHIAACMAEHQLTQPVLGIAMDGLGHGSDGIAWGGEFLICDYRGFKRVAHLETTPMAGGQAAIANPWRMAVAHLYKLMGKQNQDAELLLRQFEQRIGKQQVDAVCRQIASNINCPVTSSAGRLFDAAAALLGVCDSASYEGQAAMLLETLAGSAITNDPTDRMFNCDLHCDQDGRLVIDTDALIADLIAQILSRRHTPEALAYRFHRTLAQIMIDVSSKLLRDNNLSTVCLSGGVFQNKLFTELTIGGLRQLDIDVRMPRKLPPNDGGISLGQAIIAAAAEVH